jgi:hypothetical protein
MMRNWFAKHGSLACAYVIAALACVNVWSGNGILNTRAGGDSPFLLQRTFELAANLHAGVFPARWMPDAALGFGYPFFNFYASLPYYFAAVLNLIGIDLLTAIKLTQTIGMFAACGAMYLLASQWLTRDAAALAAVAYTLAPFHLANVYVRGDSLSEFWAFVWMPLILWSLGWRAHVRWLTLIASLACLVLTHNVTLMIFAPFISVYALMTLLIDTQSRRTRLMQLVAAAVLAMALSAWFWLPAIAESSAVQLGDQTTGYFNFANHFRLENLVPTDFLFDYSITDKHTPFSMSLLQAVLVVLGAIFWRARARDAAARWLVLLCAAIATLMITPFSRAIWQAITPLQLTQFPWRFLSVQALFVALLIGKLADIRRSAIVFFALATALSVSALIKLPNDRLEISADDVSAPTLQFYEWYSGNIGTTVRAEYLPATALPRPTSGFAVLNQAPRVWSTLGVAVESQLQTQLPNKQFWRINAADNTPLVFPLIYWSAWRASVDGQIVPTNAFAGSGMLQLNVPIGEHLVILELGLTPTQQIAQWISLLACLIYVLIFVRHRPALWRVSSVALVPFALIALLLVWNRVSARPLNSLQTVDFARRPFPQRGTVIFENEAHQRYELIAATFSSAVVAPAQPLQLDLRWRDNIAPSQLFIEQETPNGLHGTDRGRLYRAEIVRTSIAANGGAINIAADAAQGAHLLRLVAHDASGAPLKMFVQNDALDAVNLYGVSVNRSVPSAPPSKALRVFNNVGIALNSFTWQQTGDRSVCLKPTWHATRPIADALQMSLRLQDADGRTLGSIDTQPQLGLAPTWSWRVNDLVRDGVCDIQLSRALKTGERYRVQIIWYRLNGLQEMDRAELSGIVGDPKDNHAAQ